MAFVFRMTSQGPAYIRRHRRGDCPGSALAPLDHLIVNGERLGVCAESGCAAPCRLRSDGTVYFHKASRRRPAAVGPRG